MLYLKMYFKVVQIFFLLNVYVLRNIFPNSWVNKNSIHQNEHNSSNQDLFYIFTVLWKYRVNSEFYHYVFLIKNKKDIYLFPIFGHNNQMIHKEPTQLLRFLCINDYVETFSKVLEYTINLHNTTIIVNQGKEKKHFLPPNWNIKVLTCLKNLKVYK